MLRILADSYSRYLQRRYATFVALSADDALYLYGHASGILDPADLR